MTSHILYVTMKEPPRRGSLQEIVLHRYILNMEYQKTEEVKILVEAMVQATSKDRGEALKNVESAWKDLVSSRFPWFEQEKKEEKKILEEVYKEMVKEGPFRIAPVVSPKVNRPRVISSKLAEKINDPQRHLRQLGSGVSRLQQPGNQRGKGGPGR